MLGFNGTIRLWYIDNITDMRLGKYRLFEIAKGKFPNAYNGDAFSFLSKNRRTLKIVRYENHKVILYEVSYERGYSFMKPVFSEGQLWYELDFKYLVALLSCPVRKELEISIS